MKRLVLGIITLSFSNCALVGVDPKLQDKEFPPAVLREFYREKIPANDSGNDQYFELSAGILPAGMAVSENGYLSGAPEETGIFEFEVTLTEYSFDSYYVSCDDPNDNLRCDPDGNSYEGSATHTYTVEVIEAVTLEN